MQSHDTTFLNDLITRHSDQLTEADTRILDVMVRDPIRAAMENGKEVSFRAGVHPASAVRLARRLGFGGYPEFRAFLQQRLVEGNGEFEDPTARIAARLAKAGEGGLLASVLDSEITALEVLRASVTDADIRGFSEALLGARRVFLFGQSHAAPLCHLVALRLRRSGYDAVDLSLMQHQWLEQVAGMTCDDVLWLVNFRKVPAAVARIMQVAATRGATTLALTDKRGAALDPAPDHHIAVSRGEAGESQSLVVPMTVTNTVILDLATIDDGRTMRALAEFRDMRERLAPY
ncbi:MurR/RpiR family transcriptional regulator [Psychromarinibacter halotolerans]|uniref:MurR/RpiR family transcriptional regulator n=1 Tax=Psychromarinibacter halotolerans TaxID=1775175 RepID=A0ABV7GVI5_9RHOB|nr:MurR/RpiR family transcriptional regulator [Psychromarinibacter halotolerans]MDF0594599.1 MurR/RpiR family transcriptional regulator [Psychromarinibacter halotolerans]